MAGEVVPIGDPILNQAVQARAVTPSDSTVLIPTRALYNGSAAAADIAVIMVNDTVAVTFANVGAGEILPICVTKVMSTNTTATNIVALY